MICVDMCVFIRIKYLLMTISVVETIKNIKNLLKITKKNKKKTKFKDISYLEDEYRILHSLFRE